MLKQIEIRHKMFCSFNMDLRLLCIILIIELIPLHLIYAKDYCQYKCGPLTNIACKHNGKPGKSCVNFKAIKFNSAQKKLILSEHNNRRQIVAKGKAKGMGGKYLPSATRMPKLVWDDELAYLASLNVLTCKMRHEPCRDTEIHNGQNIYNAFTTAFYSIETVIKDGLKGWYKEVNDVELSDIEEFKGPLLRKDIGHFTQLVWSETTRVGCALSTYKQAKFNSYLFTCNYGHGNTLGHPVYPTSAKG